MDRSERIKENLIKFNKDMNWSDFDYPQNILIALLGEVSELFEEYKVKNPEDINLENIAFEVADVYIYLQKFCIANEIDMLDYVEKKMEINKERFLPKERK